MINFITAIILTELLTELIVKTFDFEYLQYKHILNLLIGGLVIHRLSNVWHFIIDRLRG